MDEIEDPDDDGVIDIDTKVSFIVMPAKKGFQAVDVKRTDRPKKDAGNATGVESSFGKMNVKENERMDPGWGDSGMSGTADAGWGDSKTDDTGARWGSGADAGWGS